MLQEYAMPFADLLRRLTDTERDAMRRLAEDAGNRIFMPITVYQSKKHGLSIIDGHHRYELAGQMGIDCPVNDLGEMNDEDARLLAKELNVARRQLDYDEWRRLNESSKAERIRRVAEKRYEGKKSIRTIAEEEGVDPKTIQKDLKECSVDRSTDQSTDGQIVGKDGVKRPATMPKAETEDDIGDTFDIPFDDQPEPVSEEIEEHVDNGLDVQDEQPLPKPKYMQPPKRGQAPPPRPHYEGQVGKIMALLQQTTTALTKFVRDEDDKTAVRFRKAVEDCKLKLVQHHWCEGSKLDPATGEVVPIGKAGPVFVGFRRLRRLLAECYKNRRFTPKQMLAMLAEEGPEDIDIPQVEGAANG